MTNLWQDLRYGVRVLAKAPGFMLVAILTLALGIGANTAIFTVVYGVLLRPLPFPHPERLVQLAGSYQTQSDELDLTMAQLRRLQEYDKPFEHIVGYTAVGFNLAVGNQAEHARGLHVSADYFAVLGVRPAMGRDFLPDEDQGDGQRVAILSYSLWMRRLGGDAGKIGQKILLNGEPYTVIGVLPQGFTSLGVPGAPDPGAPDVWAPLALVAKTAGSGENIGVLARLKPGVSPAQLDSQMDLVTADFRKEFPNDVPPQTQVRFLPYERLLGLEVRPYLFLLLGAIGFVLLIACANVASLLLSRGGLRMREISVRIAMGASRSRIFQQLLTESVLIALGGGALGLLLAYAGLGSLLAIAPLDLPRVSEVHLDIWALGFTFLISLLTGILFGVVPAFSAMRTSVNESLKEGAGRTSASPARTRLRQVLVVGEFAMSLVLLTGAGLMIATFARLLRTDPGFNPQHVLSMQFWLVGSKYNSTPQIETFNHELIQRLEALPGVDAVGVIAAGLPLERGGNNGVQIPGDSNWYSADYREISPGYFRALGVPLRQGRFFSDLDSVGAARVTIVNEAFARERFSGHNPIGQTIVLSRVPCEIVGIVGDVRSYLDQPAPPTTFVPAAQASYDTSRLFEGWFPRSIVIRARVEPLSLGGEVRDVVAGLDSSIPTGAPRSMAQVLSRSLAMRSFMVTLLSLFAGLALVLASVGIYGVIAYAVSQRTREIGLRMALGARPADVLRLVLIEGLRLVLVGVALGLAIAVALTRMLAGLLYGVSATDPRIFAAVTAILVAVALAACYVPARRAMRVDPMVALRYE
jgi:putative ABC transport system permease protein